MKPVVSSAFLAACSAASADLCSRGDDLRDLAFQLLRGHAGLGRNQNLIELAPLIEQGLSRVQVESGNRGTADGRYGAEVHQS